jgi:hypothetical protein
MHHKIIIKYKNKKSLTYYYHNSDEKLSQLELEILQKNIDEWINNYQKSDTYHK